MLAWARSSVIPQTPELELLYLDDALVVLNKPAGLLSVPGKGADKQDCLSARVAQQYSDARVVHRLDMATSGLMLMARGADSQRSLSKAFASRQIDKRYEAVVQGLVDPVTEPDQWRSIDLPISLDWPRRPLRVIDKKTGKPSQTLWQAKARHVTDQSSRLVLAPITGRSHQLRVHLAAIGHPILGDALYAPNDVVQRATRLLLHATQLRFTHPVTGNSLQFDSPAPF